MTGGPAPATPAPKPGLPPSALLLLAVNLVPLLGVLSQQWTVLSILLLYWFENVVVGGVNVLRMAFADPKSVASDAIKFFLIPFFIFHYGMFCFVHGMFILAFFGHAKHFMPSLGMFATALREAGVGFAALCIAASHFFSFVHNFMLSGEFRRVTPQQLMGQPYARVVVLHVTILIGGAAAGALGQPVPALVLLIVLKTAIDLRAHLAERRKHALEVGVMSAA